MYFVPHFGTYRRVIEFLSQIYSFESVCQRAFVYSGGHPTTAIFYALNANVAFSNAPMFQHTKGFQQNGLIFFSGINLLPPRIGIYAIVCIFNQLMSYIVSSFCLHFVVPLNNSARQVSAPIPLDFFNITCIIRLDFFRNILFIHLYFCKVLAQFIYFLYLCTGFQKNGKHKVHRTYD